MIITVNEERANINRLSEIMKDMVSNRYIKLYPEDEDLFNIKIEEKDLFYHGTSRKIGDIIDYHYHGYLCSSKFLEIHTTWDNQSGNTNYYNDKIFLTQSYRDAVKWANLRSEHDKSSPVMYMVRGEDIFADFAVVSILKQTFPISAIALKLPLEYQKYCVKVSRLTDQRIEIATTGNDYPKEEDLIDAIIEDTGLPKRKHIRDYTLIDTWVWDYNDINPEKWNDMLPIIKERIETLYNAGIIRDISETNRLYQQEAYK
jgi:hypothetical protein